MAPFCRLSSAHALSAAVALALMLSLSCCCSCRPPPPAVTYSVHPSPPSVLPPPSCICSTPIDPNLGCSSVIAVLQNGNLPAGVININCTVTQSEHNHRLVGQLGRELVQQYRCRDYAQVGKGQTQSPQLRALMRSTRTRTRWGGITVGGMVCCVVSHNLCDILYVTYHN